MEDDIRESKFWTDYKRAMQRSVPNQDSVQEIANNIETLGILSGTSVDIDGMVAAFDDVCQRAGDVEKVRSTIQKIWPDEPRILHVIRESAKYANSADYFLAYYDSPVSYRNKVNALLAYMDSLAMTYIVSGSCYGNQEDTVVIQIDPGDMSFAGRLYTVSVRGVFTKALCSSGAFVIRLCDALNNRYTLYGIRMKNGEIESIPADALRRTLEEQADGKCVPLRSNETTDILPDSIAKATIQTKVQRN